MTLRVLLIAASCAGLSGCGASIVSSNGPAGPASVQVAAARGIVMGGQQPVAGVTLQLYQASGSGYGATATTLGPSTQTLPSGNFNLPSYTCSSGSQVFLLGTGGQPIAATQSTSAVTNNNLAMIVGLGTCGGTQLNSFINMNELTTVATVWALAPFMTGPAAIGTSSTNLTGLANAFAAINEVVDTTNGHVSGPALPTGATLPTAEINTLADILEQCVNSGGGTAGDGSNCGNLFNLAPDATGTVYPTDTVTAALNIAHNPGRNVSRLNALRSSSPVFQPALSVNSPPTDWNIGITYAPAGVSAPSSLAVDSAGAVWVTGKTGSTLTKLNNTGAVAVQVTNGVSAPTAVAIDTSGNAWVTNGGNSTLTEANSTGSTTVTFSGNGLSAPGSVAIDGAGDVWVGNTTGSTPLSGFNSSGGALSGSPFSGGGANAPAAVAITPK